MRQSASLLITGGSGFTGRCACQHFQKLGWEVTAVVRNKGVGIQGVKVIACDLTKREAVESIIHNIKPDYILHLAGVNSVHNSWDSPLASIEGNVLSTLYLLETVRRLNNQSRIIIVGSALQYNQGDKPLHPYSVSKTMQVQLAEHWEHLFDMDIVMTKPTNLIGPGPSKGICSLIAEEIASQEQVKGTPSLHINDLSAKRDFLDVRDVVRAYDLIFQHGKKGKLYEIGSGQMRSLGEVVDHYQRLTELPILIEELRSNSSEELPSVNNENIYELGWKPVKSFRSSLVDILQYYRQSRKND
ncbi:NAD-dependent epimerase/dehydratase family protein [Guptibacillus hwajinpoensis]|uniref:NAD-dependent epimerase/dehydratase domain-containing protein n=1 Tax=Guptibacillus hwajinpoensis TaxID=208199 RepID=A0A0J6FWW5_9BACL|nr:NAD-dependent epimerase/dehydratase family protein [Alkalihalobacillus macyae]KMM38867.1 hypothetical protein AB986_06300 [Alkalihalobacillus macyae]